MSVVPSTYRPPLVLGDVGKDVEAAQRACWRYLTDGLNGVSLNARNGQFGTGLLRDVRVIQRVHDIKVYSKTRPNGYVTGNIGRRTWEVLEPWLDDRCHVLLRAAAHEEALEQAGDVENRMIRAGTSRWYDAIGHPSRWRYGGVRPVSWWWPEDDDDVKVTDCSGLVVLERRIVGGQDPQGFGFDGRAFTGWLRSAATEGRAGAQKIAVEQARAGDLAHYGNTEGAQHVGRLLEDYRGNDTFIGSFGSNPPSKRNLSRPGYRPLDFVTRHPYVKA